jgi:hypothetical protein
MVVKGPEADCEDFPRVRAFREAFVFGSMVFVKLVLTSWEATPLNVRGG